MMFPFKSSQSTHPIAPFLLLPAELRLHIYAYVFTTDTGICDLQNRRHLPRHYLALLSVCKQIYCEAGTLPMKLNSFTLDLLSLDIAMVRFTRPQRYALRSLRLEATLPGRQWRWPERPLYPFDEKRLDFDMRRLKGLREVHVRILYAKVEMNRYMGDPVYEELQLKKDVEAAAEFMRAWVLRGREEERLRVVVKMREVEGKKDHP